MKVPVTIIIGAKTIETFSSIGRMSIFIYRFFYWFFKPPLRLKLIMSSYILLEIKVFYHFLSGAFTGMVLAYQTYFGFKLINIDSLVGPVVALSMARELAPVLAGLIVSGRAGGAMAAQIGTMKVTEQIDALEVMGINSFNILRYQE